MKAKAIKWLSDQIRDDTCKAELDIIEFCKKCVRDCKERESTPKNNVDVDKYFGVLWGVYPRKINKEQAKKTFEHKIRGLSVEQCNEKCNAIYKAIVKYAESVKGKEMQYVAHFSSFLNANVPNSKHFKGR